VYVEPCSALPIGFGAQVAALMTPMDRQPFGTERYVSYAASLWNACLGDPDLSTAVAHGINARLDHDLHLSVHAEHVAAYAPLHSAPSPGSAPGAPASP
jgi:lactam utilization protein B